MKVRIFSLVNWEYFREMCDALAFSFRELGCDAKACKWDVTNNNEFGDVNIVVISHRAFDPKKLLPNYSEKVLLQTEQLWNRRESGIYDKGEGFDLVLELFKANCEIEKGTENVRYFPLGYSEIFAKHDFVENAPSYSGYFFGSMTIRRQHYMSLLNGSFKNIFFEQGASGSYRDARISRAIINLNINFGNRGEYSPLRCLLVQCKERFLLSEKTSGDYGAYEPNKHFIEFNGEDDLIEKFNYWSNHPTERTDFASNAYTDLKENHQMTMYLEDAIGDLL